MSLDHAIKLLRKNGYKITPQRQEILNAFIGNDSELVQLKLNIGASGGDSAPPEVKKGTPTYRSGSLRNQINL